jgi:hypothetical protein
MPQDGATPPAPGEDAPKRAGRAGGAARRPRSPGTPLIQVSDAARSSIKHAMSGMLGAVAVPLRSLGERPHLEGERTMSSKQILGIVLAIVGVILLIVAYNGANAPLDQLSSTVTGRFTSQTMLYGILGVAAALGGVLLAVSGRRA